MANDSPRQNADEQFVSPHSVDYWLSRPIEERLAELERLRQLKYGYDPETAQVERVLSFGNLSDEDD